MHRTCTACFATLITLLGTISGAGSMASAENNFGDDVEFLQSHTDAVVLRQGTSAIVVVPSFQGRVMTASADGDRGESSGWINYDLVRRGVVPKSESKDSLESHILAFGGEERFWLGPEGGQYSIFFAPNSPFEFSHWFTPGPIDRDAWKVTSRSASNIALTHAFSLTNHSGTRFKVRVDRAIRLLSKQQIEEQLQEKLAPGLKAVAYESVNRVSNEGDRAWSKPSGLLSIWMLCMFKPSATTTTFVPFATDVDRARKIVTDDYFGKVPSDRLVVGRNAVYFRCDGKSRGKIGFSPERSLGVAGSYDPAAKRVTLLLFNQTDQHSGYVNSLWELQENPYQGDAINSYNDGPVDDSGEQMGPFYELESSSPALALEPGQTAEHRQTILHMYGEQDQLQKAIARKALVRLEDVSSAFK